MLLKNKKILHSILLSLPIPFQAFSSEVSFSEYVDYVESQSPYFESLRNEIKAAATLLDKSQAYFLPTVTAKVGTKFKDNSEVPDEHTATLNMNMSIVTEATKYELSKAENDLAYKKALFDVEVGQMTTTLASSIVSIHKTKDLVEKMRFFRRDTAKYVDTIQLQFDAGLTTQSDIEQANLLITRINDDISNLENTTELAVIELEMLTGLSFPTDGVGLPSVVVMDSFGIDDSGLSIDLKSEEFKLASTKAAAKIQNSIFDLSIVGKATQNLDFSSRDRVQTDYEESYIGLNFSVNVFDYAAYKDEESALYKYKSQIADRDYKHIEQSNNKRLIRGTIKTLNHSLKNNILQIKQLDEVIKTKILELDIGKSSNYEVLNLKFELFQLEKNKIEIEKQIISNKLELEYLNGIEII